MARITDEAIGSIIMTFDGLLFLAHLPTHATTQHVTICNLVSKNFDAAICSMWRVITRFTDMPIVSYSDLSYHCFTIVKLINSSVTDE